MLAPKTEQISYKDWLTQELKRIGFPSSAILYRALPRKGRKTIHCALIEESTGDLNVPTRRSVLVRPESSYGALGTLDKFPFEFAMEIFHDLHW